MANHRLEDEFGNIMLIKDDNIFIKFPNEEISRKIGTLNRPKKWLFVKRERSKHLLKVANAYGFNYHILKTGRAFTNVRLSDEYGTYEIPVEYILEKGSFLHFKQQGFERQIFLTIKQINEFTIR